MTYSDPAAPDPKNLPKRMTRNQLEAWILFGICVANKPADATWRKLNKFLGSVGIENRNPFHIVNFMIATGQLGRKLREVRFGQYTRINRAFREAVRLNLDNISVETLEAVHGIGAKTARMIILYYRPATRVAVIDTHILKWLRTLGHDVPKSSPSGKMYAKLEQIFLRECDKRGKTAAELDTIIWQSYAIKS